MSFLKDSWTCPICAEKPFDNFAPLKTVMEAIYHECKQVSQTVKMVYISDLSNNLSKIKQHFNECVDLDSPLCTITLVYPDGVHLLNGTYSFVFIDNDITDKQELINSIDIGPEAMVCFVDGTKQVVLK
jgi:hypothetical protein